VLDHLCPLQGIPYVSGPYRVGSIQPIRTLGVGFASIEGGIDPWGPIVLQLKEGSTPGVRSCFSSRRDRPQGSDLA